MEDDQLETRPVRLVNFVSEEQLDQARKTRGERVDDGTAQRNRPLYDILRENKEKKDAEFNERFKHRPPKALDEDETEFLEKLETSRKEYEQQIADEDAKQLRCFQMLGACSLYIFGGILRKFCYQKLLLQSSMSSIYFSRSLKAAACPAMNELMHGAACPKDLNAIRLNYWKPKSFRSAAAA